MKKTAPSNLNELVASAVGSTLFFMIWVVRSEMIGAEAEILRAFSFSLGPIALIAIAILKDGLNLEVPLNLETWV